MRRRVSRTSFVLRTAAAALVGFAMNADAARAQLRPLDPLDRSMFEAEENVGVSVGAAAYSHQRASLAGVEGRLWELGTFEAWWRTGRVILIASGSSFRRLEEPAVFAAPHGDTNPPAGSLEDAGDFHVATAVELLERSGSRVFLRFGTRLPTTDNRVGLERDRTDFYALVGSTLRPIGAILSLEAGLGVHGTRDPELEQSDVLLYSASIGRGFGPVLPRITLLGQVDGLRSRAPRGNEDLQELRLDVRVGDRRWLEVGVVRGLRPFSPGTGVRLVAGTRI